MHKSFEDKGLICNPATGDVQECKAILFISSDKIGDTISLGSLSDNVQIRIPAERILKYIKDNYHPKKVKK